MIMERENKFRLQYLIDLFSEKPKIDLYFFQMGAIPLVHLCSFQAFREFEKMVPNQIDRDDHRPFLAGKVVPNSFAVIPSNPNWDLRRKEILKTIGINFASKYIKMMIEVVDNWAKNIPIGENLNLTIEMNRLTFRIITRVLFGRDIDKMDKCTYISPADKSISILNYEDWYFKYSKDELEGHFSFKGKIFSISWVKLLNWTICHKL